MLVLALIVGFRVGHLWASKCCVSPFRMIRAVVFNFAKVDGYRSVTSCFKMGIVTASCILRECCLGFGTAWLPVVAEGKNL